MKARTTTTWRRRSKSGTDLRPGAPGSFRQSSTHSVRMPIRRKSAQYVTPQKLHESFMSEPVLYASCDGLARTEEPLRAAGKSLFRRTVSLFAKCLCVALLYYLAVVISMKLRFSTSGLCLLWLPNAVLVGTLTLNPKRRWWAYVFAVIPAHIAGMSSYHIALSWMMYQVAFNVASTAASAAILQRFKPGFSLETLKAVLVILAVLIGVPGIANLLAVYPVMQFTSNASLLAHNWYQGLVAVWVAAWMNNTASYIAFVPTILVCATQGNSWFRALSLVRVAERVLVAIVFVTVTLLVYRHVYLIGSLQEAFFLVPIALLVWIAVRYGPASTCWSVTGLVCISAWCAYAGEGPFLQSGSIDRVTAMQISWIIISAPALALAAVVRERKLATLASWESEGRFRQTADALNHAHAELQQLTHRLLQAQDEERRRIARELHDDVNQRLAVLMWELDALVSEFPDRVQLRSRVSKMRSEAAGVAEIVRDLSHELHSATLHHLGIVRGLEGLCETVSQQHNINVDADIDPVHDLPDDVSLCLFRVAQEAMNNAVKHAKTGRIEVKLVRHAATLHLEVRDMGVGFDPATAPNGLGLVSMRERLRMVGGRFVLHSSPGYGTLIEATVDCAQSGQLGQAAS
jgi:signal transduction histidine kinase